MTSDDPDRGRQDVYRSLCWEDVKVGDVLPSITYELSLLRLVALVRATGLYDPVHYDGDYARAAGTRDAFISTPHVVGLLRRLLTDWSGPGADILSLAFRINGQSCKDDVLSISGRVGAKYQTDAGDPIIEVADIVIDHAHDPAAVTGTAILRLPRRGQMDPPGAISGHPSAAPVDLARFVNAAPLQPVSPISLAQMHLWCECMEDWNPLYWDETYAAGTRHGGLIVPFGEWLFGPGASAAAGVGYMKPGEAIPPAIRSGLHGLPRMQALRKTLMTKMTPTPVPVDRFPEMAVSGIRIDYLAPIRPGDRVYQHIEAAAVSPLKRTRIGDGHFLTLSYANFNDEGKAVSVMTIDALQYHV